MIQYHVAYQDHANNLALATSEPCRLYDAAIIARNRLYDGSPRVSIVVLDDQHETPRYRNIVSYRNDGRGIMVTSH